MRRVRLAAALTIGAAVLAGCSSEQQANETLPSTSATAAESSEALPPLGPPDLPMPDEAREMTPEGAESFIRYYMEVYNAAQESMDPTYMDELSQGCALCDGIIANLTEDSAAGYRYVGGQVEVTSVGAAPVSERSAELVFSMTQARLRVESPGGDELAELSAPAAELQCGAVLDWSSVNESWVLGQWDVN
ncbi:DUF6318 family protein [Modestobacter sp. SYSU DS0875]